MRDPLLHMSNEIHPELAYSYQDLLLVDIRPWEERLGPLGFVPSSVCAPEGEHFLERMRALEDLVLHSQGVALICQSGRRTGALQALYPTLFGRPVLSLQGGLLGWMRQGLPLAGVNLPASSPYRLEAVEQTFRVLSSCFTAEMVESALNHDSTLPDPVLMLSFCFEAEGVDRDLPTPEGLRRVLDRMAALSRRSGTTVERIRDNLDSFLVFLEDGRPEAPCWTCHQLQTG